ncbi:MAG: response regulator transcription factor [Cyclobacteriaceae bacterium]|jgi:DNA-binding response OmpR family regulator|nr:response regulator transcription factor [Cyclobacteriaceae bacterium]
MKVLLIEDEPELRKGILQYLLQENYVVETAEDFKNGSQKTGNYDYDCVLVDLSLPGGNGLDIVKELKRQKSKTGIIIISAKDSLDDKIKGLELGADDYLSKPFHLAELNARIKALIRRKNFDGEQNITINEIRIQPEDRRVFVHDTEVILTAKEFDLLIYFVSNKNRVVSKNAIAEHLSGDYADHFDQLDFIYSHIKNLRKKLVEKGCADYISTVYGIGYNFKTNL